MKHATWAVECHVEQRVINNNGNLDSSVNSCCSNLVIGFHCHCYHLQHCQLILQNYCFSVCSTCSSDDCSYGGIRERGIVHVAVLTAAVVVGKELATVSLMCESACSSVDCSCGSLEKNLATVSAMCGSACGGVGCSCDNTGTTGERI